MYKVARTEIPGQSFRPFNERLGRYTPANFPIPTQSYRNLPQPGRVTGGLGADSSIGSNALFWIAALGGAYWLFFRGR
jgi:hypothetical protein